MCFFPLGTPAFQVQQWQQCHLDTHKLTLQIGKWLGASSLQQQGFWHDLNWLLSQFLQLVLNFQAAVDWLLPVPSQLVSIRVSNMIELMRGLFARPIWGVISLRACLHVSVHWGAQHCWAAWVDVVVAMDSDAVPCRDNNLHPRSKIAARSG